MQNRKKPSGPVKPAPAQTAAKRPVQAQRPAAKPRTKEEAVQQMAEKDPQKMAALLREILKNR